MLSGLLLLTCFFNASNYLHGRSRSLMELWSARRRLCGCTLLRCWVKYLYSARFPSAISIWPLSILHPFTFLCHLVLWATCYSCHNHCWPLLIQYTYVPTMPGTTSIKIYLKQRKCTSRFLLSWWFGKYELSEFNYR